jgi:hypothetical protein
MAFKKTIAGSSLPKGIETADNVNSTIESTVETSLAALVASAPETLDTLNELAAALGDDANFATTVTTALSGKSNTGHGHAISDVSGLQTALNGKASSSHTHTISQITDYAPVDVSGKQDIVSGVSSTEIGYLDGVTSAIQTQLDAKASSSNAVFQSPELISATERVQVIEYNGVGTANLPTANATVFINTTSGPNSLYQINVQGATGNLLGELSAGESITTTLVTSHSGGRPNGIQIDGSNVSTVLWLGGAPTSVTSGSTYAYTVNITKLYSNVTNTVNPTGLRVLASSSEYKP